MLTCASALLLASSASADTVLVKYGLLGTVTAGATVLTPLGGGIATVEFQGTPGSGIATGPAHLVSLTLFQPGPVLFTVASDLISVAPGVAFLSLGSGGGSLTAFGTGGLSLTGNPGSVAPNSFHCSGTTCSPGLGLPPSLTFPLFGGGPGTASLFGAVASPGALTISFTHPIAALGTPIGGTLPPIPVYIAFTGVQVGARTHIATPEPGTLPLLASAVAVAAGLAWRARRRQS